MAASVFSNALLSPVTLPSNPKSISFQPKFPLLKFPTTRSHPSLSKTTTFCSSDAANAPQNDTPIELSTPFIFVFPFWFLLWEAIVHSLQGIRHSQPSLISTRFVKFYPTGTVGVFFIFSDLFSEHWWDSHSPFFSIQVSFPFGG